MIFGKSSWSNVKFILSLPEKTIFFEELRFKIFVALSHAASKTLY